MMVPLEQIATITMGKGPAQIQHLNGKRTIAVSANVHGRSSGEVTADAMKIAHAIDFPPGSDSSSAAPRATRQESSCEMGIALVMGICAHVPGAGDAVRLVHRAAAGDAVAAALADRRRAGAVAHEGTLNLMSFIGVIMLMGLVAKNAILLLDCARKEESAGHRSRRSADAAGRVRLRPILMTTFALIAGMMPVAIGARRGRRVLPADGGGHHRRHDHCRPC